MKKDPTLFRERFNRWKSGQKVYAAGKPITDDEYYKTLETVAVENNKEWNKQRTKDGVKQLSEDEEVMRVMNDHTYDYRGYYNKYRNGDGNAKDHWTDEFKTYLHPTFSDESIYAPNNKLYVGRTKFNPSEMNGGHWYGLVFMPSTDQWKSYLFPRHKNGLIPSHYIGEEPVSPGLPTVSVKAPTPRLIAAHAWATENPNRRGMNADGTWSQYPDPAGGGKMNSGPGSLVRNAAAPDGVLPDKPRYTTAEVEKPWIDNYNEGWPKIAAAYDERYGTKAYQHPSDTINPKTRLLAVSTRGKTGSLSISDWPSFYQAMADGNIPALLVESRTKFGEDGNKKYDNDRIRREAEALWPGRFEVFWDKANPKKKAVVKVKKK